MKKLCLSLFALLLTLSLAACASAELAEGFDETEVKTRAKELVATINTQDYDAVIAEIREDLQSQLSAQSLDEAWTPLLDDSGTFEAFSSVAVYGQADKATGDNYAVCVLVCKYEDASRTFTISMDEDMEIVGLYMK
jgi:hypothetical protein